MIRKGGKTLITILTFPLVREKGEIIYSIYTKNRKMDEVKRKLIRRKLTKRQRDENKE